MKYIFLVIITLTLALPSFGSDWVEEIFEKFDDSCAHNSNGNIVQYNPRTVDFIEEMAKLRILNKGCEEGRVYSRNRAEGVETFLQALKSESYAGTCVQENLSPRERGLLRSIIRDESNLGVLTSTEYTGDASGSCSYYNFWVYRADGRILKFTLNYTD